MSAEDEEDAFFDDGKIPESVPMQIDDFTRISTQDLFVG